MDELLEDVDDAVTMQAGHYLGTIVLAETGGSSYDIVDGQQRLCSLFLLLHALLTRLDPSDRFRITTEDNMLGTSGAWRIRFGANASSVADLLADLHPKPESPGQRRLVAAHQRVTDRAGALVAAGGADLVRRWLEALQAFQVVRLVERDTGRAVRLFQTVNDRGKPLSTMEKAKALLVYYSNCYLAGRLDSGCGEARTCVFASCGSSLPPWRGTDRPIWRGPACGGVLRHGMRPGRLHRPVLLRPRMPQHAERPDVVSQAQLPQHNEGTPIRQPPAGSRG